MIDKNFDMRPQPLRKLKELPIRQFCIKDIVLHFSKYKAPFTDNEEPHRTNCRTDKVDPQNTRFRTDQVMCIRVCARTDTELHVDTKSSTEVAPFRPRYVPTLYLPVWRTERTPPRFR